MIITNVHFGGSIQIYRPMYSAKPEHVLVLKIASVRPAIYFYGKPVCSLPNIIGDIKFRYIVCSLAITHFLAINPYIHTTIHPIKVEKNLLSLPIGRNCKVPAIGTYRILFDLTRISSLCLYERRIIFIGIGDIRIYRCSIPMHFPIRRYGYLFPRRDIITRFIKMYRSFRGLLCPVELPISI